MNEQRQSKLHKLRTYILTKWNQINWSRVKDELLRTLVGLIFMLSMIGLMTCAQIASDSWFANENPSLPAGEKNVTVKAQSTSVIESNYASEPLHDRLFDLLPDWSPKHTWLPDLLITTLLVTTALFNVLWTHHTKIEYQGIVVLRRVLWLLGILYAFRACIFVVTTVPSPRLSCVPQYAPATEATEYLLLMSKMVSGRVTACTDNIYSGHTALIITLVFTNITYSGLLLIKIYAVVHGFFAIGAILITHLHYTVDILVAILVASMVFVVFHFMIHIAIDKKVIRKLDNFHEVLVAERSLTGRIVGGMALKLILWIDGMDLRIDLDRAEESVTLIVQDNQLDTSKQLVETCVEDVVV